MTASYKTVFAIFPPSSEDDLRSSFVSHQFTEKMKRMSGSGSGGRRSGPGIDAAKGLDINPVHIFADRQVAEAAIQAKAERGGKAIAVRIVQRDPETQMLIDPATGQRRTVWLVGATCPVHEEAI